MNKIQIVYSKSSKKFLDKNKNIISEEKSDELVIKVIRKLI